MRRNVIVDIDRTLSNCFWRDHLINSEGGWDAYHAVMGEDEPVHDVVALVTAMYSSGYNIVGITARPEKYRKATTEWLDKHKVCMDELLMRPDGDFRPTTEVKKQLASERFYVPSAVAFVIDDREDIVTMFRGMGVTALQVFARQS